MFIVIYEYHGSCRCLQYKSLRTSVESTLQMAKDYGKGDSCIDIKSIYRLDSDHDYMHGDPPLKSWEPNYENW